MARITKVKATDYKYPELTIIIIKLEFDQIVIISDRGGFQKRLFR